MCGITVTLSPQINASQMMAMNDLIRHRGPDDEGYVFFTEEQMLCMGGRDTPSNVWFEQTSYQPVGRVAEANLSAKCHLAFGHRRLSVVDLSALGHQPMCDVSRRYWITYNGEVYNHLELREELQKLGYQFNSHSDTEVILVAYQAWGESCLSRFNGMWAFSIYDQQEKVLFIARDRFGVKPLYYWNSPSGELAFSSEIKQFTAMRGWAANLNPQRTYDFLAWGLTDHTDETLFDRVYQLAPGCCISVDVSNHNASLTPDGRLKTKRWYTLTPQVFTGTFDEAVEKFRQHLWDAVALRLRADVPIGSCLSGGLDSSSIVCVMKQLLSEQGGEGLQKTFSACTGVKRFDERDWIEAVVESTGVEAHYVYPQLDNLFDEVPEITWHQDEPFGSTSIYAQWHVFRTAAESGVTVMLDGQGADEQLAGYHGFFSPRLGGLFKSGNWLTMLSELRAMQRIHGYSMSKGIQYLGNAILPRGLRDELRRRVGKTSQSPGWLDLGRLGCVPQDPFESTGAVGADTVRDLSIAQLTASNLQMLLHWEDRDSMAHAIESRVPFLDYRLVEFVIGLPDEFKLSGGVTKRVLRSAMSEIIPDVIRDRMDKLGFVTPEEVWVKENGTALFRSKLELAINSSNGIIKHSALDVFDEMVAGRSRFDYTIWRFISFGAWIDRFGVNVQQEIAP